MKDFDFNGLKPESEIISSWCHGDIISPWVSISCMVFNHVDYVESAIIGFLSQETKYAFEILIHDDASTDGTQEVIRAYQNEYPNIIKPVYQIENRYSQGFSVGRENIGRSKAKYIASCEGDDYWTSPVKLELQVDYLERNPEINLCFTPSRYFDYELNKEGVLGYYGDHEIVIPPKKVIALGGGVMASATRVFRKEAVSNIPALTHPSPVGDYSSQIFLSLPNGAGYIPHESAMYRLATPGSWSHRNRSSTISYMKDDLIKRFLFLDGVNEFCKYEFDDAITLAKFRAVSKVLQRLVLEKNYLDYRALVNDYKGSFLGVKGAVYKAAIKKVFFILLSNLYRFYRR